MGNQSSVKSNACQRCFVATVEPPEQCEELRRSVETMFVSHQFLSDAVLTRTFVSRELNIIRY